MKVQHIDHQNLTVQDFDTSLDWYSRVLGFELVEESIQDGTRWGTLRSGDAMLCIYEFPECNLEDRHAMRAKGFHGINHFGLRVKDRSEWEATVDNEKLDVLYGGPIRWTHSTSWYITDPTGYEIEVACWDNNTIVF